MNENEQVKMKVKEKVEDQTRSDILLCIQWNSFQRLHWGKVKVLRSFAWESTFIIIIVILVEEQTVSAFCKVRSIVLNGMSFLTFLTCRTLFNNLAIKKYSYVGLLKVNFKSDVYI